jgi:LacI family transcriptional regulator
MRETPAGRPSRLTLADVAARAGVSRATVSLVLRDSPLVAESTRIKVRSVLNELGYVYNRSAASMRAARSRTVGLLIPGLSNPFFAELAAGVDQVLDEAGLALFLADSNEAVAKQERVILRMREHGADGIIICPAIGTTKELISRLNAWASRSSKRFGKFLRWGIMQARTMRSEWIERRSISSDSDISALPLSAASTCIPHTKRGGMAS